MLSIEFEPADGPALATPLAGQYITLKIPGGRRSCSAAELFAVRRRSAADYRISVKREKHGLVSQWLHANIHAGSVMEAAAPRGDFHLTDDTGPVVLLSAGIGATPVLAMLHALAGAQPTDDLVAAHHPQSRRRFATETADLIRSLPTPARTSSTPQARMAAAARSAGASIATPSLRLTSPPMPRCSSRRQSNS